MANQTTARRIDRPALVVAFTARATPATALARFHGIWWVLVACGTCVTTLSLFLPRRRAPAPPAAEAIAAHEPSAAG